jgi:phage-related minor tail protein
MAGKEYKIAFELQAKLESSYNTVTHKVLDNLEKINDTARAIEAIRISGDMVRPLREGLQATEREFDQLRRMPRIDGIFTETVKELKEAVKESAQLARNLQEIARIRMPSNMFGNDLQRYTRDMQDLERRMREINDIQGPQPGEGGGGGGGGEGDGGSSGVWALGGAALAGGIGVAAIAGLGLAGHAVFSFSEEYQEAMNQIQSATGATSQQMEGFSDIAEHLYNQNMGESFYDIAESLSVVRQVTKQSGQDLEDATRNGMIYADVFGEEIAESTKAADTMMRNFGITSTEAYNLLAQGAQKGLNKSGELLDTANEYSGYFAKLGFSANGMFDTFAAGLDAGAFNLDKVGDGIKEFGIRTKDGSKASLEAYKAIGLNGAKMTAEFAAGGKTAQEAFLETTKAIAAIKDPFIQNQASVQLFGTQAEDLEARVIKAYANVQSQFDMTKNTMDEINKVKYNTIGQAFGSIGRTLQTSLILPISKHLLPMFSGLAGKMTEWVPAVVGAFGKVGGAFKEAIESVQHFMKNGFGDGMEGASVNFLTSLGVDSDTAEVIILRLSSIYKTFAGTISNIKKLFSGEVNVAGMFGFKKKDMKGITSGFKDIVGGLMGYWADFGKNLLELWPNIRGIFISLGTIVKTVAPIVGALVTTAVAGFKAIYNAVLPIATYLAGKMWPIVQNIFNFLSTQAFPQVARLIAALMPQIMGIASKVQEAFGAIGGWISRTFEALKPTLDNLFATFEFVWGAIKIVISNAIDAIGGVISGLLTSLGGIIDFVTGVFSGDWGKAWQGIREVFEGIFTGIGAVLVFPINVAVDAINAAIRGINKIKFDIPDWVPGMGGDTFGFDIPTIPHVGGYANGGYVDSPELAWIGEGRSPEWIIPENNSARSQALLQAANRSMGGGDAGGTTIGDFIYKPVFNFYGPADQEAVQKMEQRNQQEFGKQFADYKRQAMRRSLST